MRVPATLLPILYLWTLSAQLFVLFVLVSGRPRTISDARTGSELATEGSMNQSETTIAPSGSFNVPARVGRTGTGNSVSQNFGEVPEIGSGFGGAFATVVGAVGNAFGGLLGGIGTATKATFNGFGSAIKLTLGDLTKPASLVGL